MIKPKFRKYFLQILQGQSTADHDLILFLDSVIDVVFFVSGSRRFQIFGPHDEMASMPYNALLVLNEKLKITLISEVIM